jgi:hypothetical protein
MDARLTTPFRVLRLALGLTALLAGLDKFFNILTDWSSYVSPAAARWFPVPLHTFMGAVGVIEMAVGVAILWAAPRLGAYVASAWLLLVAGNLVLGGHFDIAVRDVVMSIAAFTLARACEVPGFVTSRFGATWSTAHRVTAAIILGSLTLTSPAWSQTTQPHHTSAASAAATLHQDMRKLWTDHVIWTRDYIVAAVGDQPDAQAAAARLLKNQDDIGAAVASFYGKAAGDKLTTLLREHISIAVDLIKSAKAGDKASQQQADAKWHRNGEAIADFLSQANPNWHRATLVDMMNTHLSTTTDEVVARLTKNWDGDVRAFDKVYNHILVMAGALSDGIVRQFPEKFKG